MWYDPVFKVVTLDGREVWRRRHYRVKRADRVGTFYFSVLDNGVTSKCAYTTPMHASACPRLTLPSPGATLLALCLVLTPRGTL